jgi:hypothetical protein
MEAAVSRLNCELQFSLKFPEPPDAHSVCADNFARLKITGKVTDVDRPVAVSSSAGI